MEPLEVRLSKSKFRSRFNLSLSERRYLLDKGIDTIRSHAEDFIKKRIAPANLENDGQQTPMRGHPVFVAQHATATCCRGCIEKWHGIKADHDLSDVEQKYIVDVIMWWIGNQLNK